MNSRAVALRVSAAAVALASAKGAVGLATGSIAILSSALDSAGDALASFGNYLFLVVASKPADDGHPFGHGKAEHLAALLQGLILLAGGVLLGWRAIVRIGRPQPIDAGTIGLITMVLSLAATFAITRFLRRAAVSTESSALAADAWHYTSDVAANLATITALVLVRITGSPLYDSILGIIVACWIVFGALRVLRGAANDLMDAALPEAEVKAIVDAIERADPAVRGWRELRSRRSAVRFVDIELLIDRSASFEHAHDVTEVVKGAIRERFPGAVVTIHAEPV
jgi:ferrous-iron efflux pump FieF